MDWWNGLFADVRFQDDFERFDVTDVGQQNQLLRDIRAALLTAD